MSELSNQERNTLFLAAIEPKAKEAIIDSIANHYGTDHAAIISELTDNDEAEHILEYMVEPHRSGASVLMQKHQLRGF
jgi:uncharacterized protein YaaQ